MADTLKVFGKTYTGVTGIIATDTSDTDKTYVRPQGSKSITANGTGIDVASYATVDVNVSSGAPSLQTKSKTYTPTTSQQTESVTADNGYDGLSKVNITVNAVTNGTLVSDISYVDSNPDITVNSSGVVNVSGGYSATVHPITSSGWINSTETTEVEISMMGTYQLSTQAAKTVTPTKSTQTAVTSGKYTTGNITVGPIPSNYITTTDATAMASDIVSSKTAYVNGSKVTGTLTFSTIYTGSSNPSSSTGVNGDIYLKVVS